MAETRDDGLRHTSIGAGLGLRLVTAALLFATAPPVAVYLAARTGRAGDPASTLAPAVVAGGTALAVLFIGLRWLVHHRVIGPLHELSSAARAVSAGDVADIEPLSVVGPSEVTELADAFNAMLDQVRVYVDDLERSRRQFQEAVAAMGDALAGTHDRQRIVEVALETALLISGGDVAVFWSNVGRVLEPRAVRSSAGDEPDSSWRVSKGVGLAGVAAEMVAASRFPGGPAPLSDLEPPGSTAMAAPLVAGTGLFGVLAVYGRATPFTDSDLEALRAFARQAEAAVANTFLHEEASRLSLTDGLTGLWNRRQFDLRLSQELDRARRYADPFSVLMLDIDRFKTVNDTHGHPVGDAVLVEVARRLTALTREVDLVARYGGEEFVVLLPKTEQPGGLELGNRIRQTIEDTPVATEAGPLSITVSLGVAAYPGTADSARHLVEVADAALYAAKAAGRNRVEAAPLLDPADGAAPDVDLRSLGLPAEDTPLTTPDPRG